MPHRTAEDRFWRLAHMSMHVEIPHCSTNGVTRSRKIDDKTFAQQVLCPS